MWMPIVWTLVAFIVLMALWAMVRFLLAWRRTHYSLPQYVLYRVTRVLVLWQWRAQLPEKPTFDLERGAVIICNHRSSVDPFFIQVLLDRPARWIVAREYVEHWMFGWFLRTCNVIPANRTGIDTAATLKAYRAACQKKLVGMLPEGRINHTPELLLSCRPGPILVALRAQVPIVPVFIFDAPYGGRPWSPLLCRAHTRVVMGEPIDLSEYYPRRKEKGLLAELALKVYKQLAILGEQPDFEPTIAGRRWKHGISSPESSTGS
jgi:1-acyl-sn-glycerol-3-phosphate acyltransferase